MFSVANHHCSSVRCLTAALYCSVDAASMNALVASYRPCVYLIFFCRMSKRSFSSTSSRLVSIICFHRCVLSFSDHEWFSSLLSVIPNSTKSSRNRICTYDPGLSWRQVRPRIWTSSAFNSHGNVWTTCTPPLAIVSSSLQTKSDPRP